MSRSSLKAGTPERSYENELANISKSINRSSRSRLSDLNKINESIQKSFATQGKKPPTFKGLINENLNKDDVEKKLETLRK
mmetsp:Transcript_25046/g.22135  ORF Transcript_25046/g.22135 Transcript_25046/m.22135 type:complete len:81 (-) Transcript_25046:1174-1416(-)